MDKAPYSDPEEVAALIRFFVLDEADIDKAVAAIQYLDLERWSRSLAGLITLAAAPICHRLRVYREFYGAPKEWLAIEKRMRLLGVIGIRDPEAVSARFWEEILDALRVVLSFEARLASSRPPAGAPPTGRLSSSQSRLEVDDVVTRRGRGLVSPF